jgi:hypothetical protein
VPALEIRAIQAWEALVTRRVDALLAAAEAAATTATE